MAHSYMEFTPKSVILLLSFLLAGLLPARVTYGQEKSKIDSLKVRLNQAKSDSSKVYLLVGLSRKSENIDLKVSMDYSEKALEIAESSGKKNLISYALFNIANVYYEQGIFEFCIRDLSRYLDIMREEGNMKGLAYGLANLGAFYLSLENFSQALKKLPEALEAFKKLNSQDPKANYTSQIMTIYNNLGIIYQKLKKPDLSISYYMKGVNLARKSPADSHTLAQLLNNIGSLYIQQGRLDAALLPITESMEIREKNGDLLGQAQSCMMFSNYYEKLKDENKSFNYLQRGYPLTKSLGNKFLQSGFAEKLYEHYDKLHKADSALKYHVLFKELSDNTKREETQKELARLELTAQFKEKEKLKSIEQKRKEQRYLASGITLFLLLIIVSLFFVLSQGRLRRVRLEKENVDLAARNLLLEKDSLEKDLELKNKELATNVMHQIQKNELIQGIVEKLLHHSRNLPDEDVNLVHGIIRELEKTMDSSVWNEFDLRFNQVHNEFYDKLNRLYPDLTPHERRLCAFLRLNMTTKEIASITGQTIRGLEVAVPA